MSIKQIEQCQKALKHAIVKDKKIRHFINVKTLSLKGTVELANLFREAIAINNKLNQQGVDSDNLMFSINTGKNDGSTVVVDLGENLLNTVLNDKNLIKNKQDMKHIKNLRKAVRPHTKILITYINTYTDSRNYNRFAVHYTSPVTVSLFLTRALIRYQSILEGLSKELTLLVKYQGNF